MAITNISGGTNISLGLYKYFLQNSHYKYFCENSHFSGPLQIFLGKNSHFSWPLIIFLLGQSFQCTNTNIYGRTVISVGHYKYFWGRTVISVCYDKYVRIAISVGHDKYFCEDNHFSLPLQLFLCGLSFQ